MRQHPPGLLLLKRWRKLRSEGSDVPFVKSFIWYLGLPLLLLRVQKLPRRLLEAMFADDVVFLFRREYDKFLFELFRRAICWFLENGF